MSLPVGLHFYHSGPGGLPFTMWHRGNRGNFNTGSLPFGYIMWNTDQVIEPDSSRNCDNCIYSGFHKQNSKMVSKISTTCWIDTFSHLFKLTVFEFKLCYFLVMWLCNDSDIPNSQLSSLELYLIRHKEGETCSISLPSDVSAWIQVCHVVLLYHQITE